jgi:sialate O-acetylesterase
MSLSSILSDGMVLQRNAEVPIWGKSSPYQTVKVTFLNKVHTTESDAHGDWKVILEDLEPGGPFEMSIAAEEELVIRNILIGDVWVLGGQSNMQLPVSRTLDLFADEIMKLDMPFIRQFTVPQTYNFHEPEQDVSAGHWMTANPSDVLKFSAAGFFFAQDLYNKHGVPIGLILTAIGGTPIEAWISEKTIREYDGYGDTLEQCKDDAYIADVIQQDEERNAAWHQNLNDNDLGLEEGWYKEAYDPSEWDDFELPSSWKGSQLEPVRGAVWFRKEIDVPASMLACDALLKLGTIIDADDTYVNGISIGNTGYRYPPRRYSVPRGLLKPGKNSITVRAISTQNTGEFIPDMPYKLIANGQEINLEGTWKYRVGVATGESAPPTFFHYKPCGLYNGMISPLRNYGIIGVVWYQGESNTANPKGYHHLFRSLVKDWRGLWNLQDLPFIYTQLANFEREDVIGSSNWAELREEQRMGLSISNTAMAVAIDIGEHNDLHPQDKKTLGQRLALCARNIAYDEEVVYSGPMYSRMERIGDAIHLHFDHIGSGLPSREGELKGFTVCGSDGVFAPAQAVISGSVIIVRHEQIQQPRHVRYAWSNNPAEANLYNQEGLPASPFTTENQAS